MFLTQPDQDRLTRAAFQGLCGWILADVAIQGQTGSTGLYETSRENDRTHSGERKLERYRQTSRGEMRPINPRPYASL
jgi:hypothetical protein